MGERACVLGELVRLEHPDIGDALHGRRALVGGELLVAEDGQAFLEAELEPVAAGDAVAGPVVEVLVGNDALDGLEVAVGGGLGARQHQAVVEDVETLVLHRPHVEVGDGDDHEDVEIVFEAEALLVPLHRALQAVHGPAAAVLLAGLDIDPEVDDAARARLEGVLDDAEIAADQGEQIARLRKGVVPDGEVALRSLDLAAARRDCRWRAAPARRRTRPRCEWCRPTSTSGRSSA